MSSDFSSIPILSYALLSNPSTRPTFISALQNALTNVGFFYLSDTAAAVDPTTVAAVIEYAPKFFDLPETEKEKVAMINSEHFFGWTRVGAERTKGKVDWREQFDFGTEWKDREPEVDPDAEYRRLWGPAQVSSYQPHARVKHSRPNRSGLKSLSFQDSEPRTNNTFVT